jgi:NitT/TauT family transport system ATP-binding protein
MPEVRKKQAQTVNLSSGLDLAFQTNDGPMHALRDVNLESGTGEFASFKGHSCCGKMGGIDG